MGYLKFDKNTLINLEQSLPKELLRTNQSGAYLSTTLIGCHTRKYHGLLVTPVPEIDDDNHVLLSSLDETIIQHGAEFNLAIHKFGGEHYSPKGHKYIRELHTEIVPRVIYRVGGVVLAKQRVLHYNENRILIKYTLLDAHSKTTLRLRPLLAFRNVNSLTQENDTINKEYQEVKNGIGSCLYNGYPTLFMQTNKKGNFHSLPDWYKGIEYSKEQERGYPYKEDLYTPGYLEVEIKKGESVYFSAGTTPINPTSLKITYEKEIEKRTARSSLYNCLKNAAHQFIYHKNSKQDYIIAGYPWFKVRARDLFISLPGCTLSIDEKHHFESIMNTALAAIHKFTHNEPLDTNIKEIDQPDVLLWAIWAIQQYCKESDVQKLCSTYKKAVLEIVDFIKNNNHPNLKIQENGLLTTDGTKKASSWMNSSIGGKPVTPRTGFLVEFNALWYNAICFAGQIETEGGQHQQAEELTQLGNLIQESFRTKFKNSAGYLFDYVDNGYVDWSVRPNMIIPLALDYSPLDKRERKSVLDYVTKELLTPKGIRSLSPKSQGYSPTYFGPQADRDYAYHQGTAWPWLMGFYIEAYLKIFGLSGLSFAENRLVSFEDEMSNNCIATISEMYDGNPPFTGRGAISFAMNVAEILRMLKLIKSYNTLIPTE
ncbi:MAG: amylo-alpha-1,6-glucosidase [Bacteroidales bacterium]|nr:amylo-alpha-1,6-glucosidase [Bacteroidales bacterium]